MMKSCRIKKYLKTEVELKLFDKLEFENLFENYLRIEVLKMIKNWILKII